MPKFEMQLAECHHTDTPMSAAPEHEGNKPAC